MLDERDDEAAPGLAVAPVQRIQRCSRLLDVGDVSALLATLDDERRAQRNLT